MRVSNLRLLLLLSSAVFLIGCTLQLSLFHRISRHERNATATSAVVAMNSFVGKQSSGGFDPLLNQRCALNFYGLPRAFESLVLPSIIKNVLRPNARYQCDVFVHYYNLTHERKGRSGAGGNLDPHEVRLLTNAVHKYSRPPAGREATVLYTMDEEEHFWKKYDSFLFRIHNTTDKRGRYLYYPWKARTYKYPMTIDNIVKMWHSIEQAWTLMDSHAKAEKIEYTRVAMLRSDVVYMTPIDIWETGRRGVHDVENKVAVIPGFGRHPVSDRMVYGPYEAVRQWSATRFRSLDQHVQWILKNNPGWGMHSEKFVDYTVLPAMRQTGASVEEHTTMCFFRARPDETVWFDDCNGAPGVSSPEIWDYLPENRQQAVEAVLGRNCSDNVIKITRMFSALECKRNGGVQETH